MSVATYSMLNPPNPAFRNDCPRGGILLNAARPNSQSPFQSPLQRPYMPPSSPSSSSSSGSDESVNRKFSPGRRITFAPLPNPRAQEPVDNKLPIIVLDSTGVDSLTNDHSDSALSLSGDDLNVGHGSVNSSPVLGAKKSSSWGSSTKKWFRPFYKPLQKAATLDIDGGALGLFRASSRESNSSTGTLTDPGAPLARRMSTGTTPSNVGPSNHFIPDRNRDSLALTPVVSDNGGVAAGTRMLNGRVYGRSRLRNAEERDDREPEFVEWGYGGMGSNKGTSASSTYAKVQGASAITEDEDDGSGMGWVRKRREAREREKREREEREAEDKAQQQEGTDERVASASESAVDEPTSTIIESEPVPTPTATSQPSQEHVTQTVAIPARPQSAHSHSTRPTQSRRSSESRGSPSGTVTPLHAAGSGRSTPMMSRMSTESTHTVTAAGVAGPSSLRNAIEVESPSSSDEDEDESEETTEREDDNQDDDADDDDDTDERKTSLCAGVEKISRHKE